MFKRILVAVDSSEPSERAVKVAGDLVRNEPETLVALVHVIDTPVLDVHTVLDASDAKEQAARKAEEMLRRLHWDFPENARLEYLVMDGRPAQQLIGAATQWKADLVVVGDHNRHALSRFMLGSVADAIVRHAPCAVLVVREPDAASDENDGTCIQMKSFDAVPITAN
jgi:nucleotide-binding universal stress UspA family protein